MAAHDPVDQEERVGAAAGARAGVVGGAAALAAGELAAAALDVAPSPVLAVGGRFIDRFAAELKEVAVALFGTNDKAALVTGTVIVSLGLAALVGVAARRRRWLPAVALTGLALVGAAAQLGDARDLGAAVWAVAALEVVAGATTMHALLAVAPRRGGGGALPGAAAAVAPGASSGSGRRRFLLTAAGASVASVLAAAWARSLLARDVVAEAAARVRLRPPRERRPLPSSQPFTVEGATPYVVANDDFYRIDTALSVPRVDASRWRLRIAGLVDAPFELGYDELLALEGVEEVVTLQCVSNEVGGDLVGNAVWQGVPLRELLTRAGVRPEAEQVFSRSVDGWTCGFPIDALEGDRAALVAYAMNGEPLPAAHGFPARLVVSGLYGYVSATKWLEQIELTRWEGTDGYWVPRGWAKEGPVKLASRIDVPRRGQEVPGSPTVLGGVAWLPSVGIGGVEVSVDDGPWQQAELGRVASVDTWVQWRFEVALEPGDHDARVRAVDRRGRVQTAEVAEPAPDGATGLHRVAFRTR